MQQSNASRIPHPDRAVPPLKRALFFCPWIATTYCTEATRCIMKTYLNWSIVVVVVCLSLVGCSSMFGDNEDAPADGPLAFNVIANDAVRVDQLESGSFSDIRDGKNVMIRTQEAFASLWNSIHADRSNTPELPSVDFDESVIVAVILGDRPTTGYEVEVSEVQLNAEQELMEVRAQERQPSGTCIVNQVVTSPYVIVRVAVDAPVAEASFEVTQESYTCDG